jgi:hypothetical protein
MTATGVTVTYCHGLREVTLPDGQTLTIRPAVGSDADGLARLYEGLTSDDLYYRFFSIYHPPRSFFERQANLDKSGGCALVATVSGGDRIVGDGAYVRLPDGGGEFGLTVAADWRGWLGPYLLDALVEVAAARGLPNLQADVLSTNHRMMALLRHRGYVVIGNGDYSALRVAIATTQSMPVWEPRKGSPLIVAETPGMRWVAETAARRAGWRVVGCAQARTRGRRGCPALRQAQPCPLALCADAVIVGFPADQEGGALVAAHQALHPGLPVTTGEGSPEEQASTVIAVLQAERTWQTRGRSIAKRGGTG